MARRTIPRESRNVAEELADAEWARQRFEASPRDGLSFIERLGDVADISTFAGPNEQHAISAGLSRRH